MFIGEYHHLIDEKNRLAVPAKFRARLDTGAVVTRGLDGSLVVYPRVDWEKLAEKLSQLPINQSNTRAFTRHMLAGAMDVSLDSQGRIVLPDYLKQYAGIKKNVVIAGLYNRLEIWDEKAWDAYKTKTEKDSDEIAENLGQLGI